VGKFYAGLIGIAMLALAAIWTLVATKRRGVRQGAAKGEALEAIRHIRDAVERGDDAEVQRLLEAKVHDKG